MIKSICLDEMLKTRGVRFQICIIMYHKNYDQRKLANIGPRCRVAVDAWVKLEWHL